MKKLLTLTLLLSLLLCGCGKEEPTETLSREDLIYGPTVEEPTPSDLVTIPEDQEAVTVPPTTPPTHIRVLTRMASLDENGQESWYRECGYDAQGRLAWEVEVGSDGVQTYRADYAYEQNTITISYSHGEGITEVVTQELDSHGRILRHQAAVPGEAVHHSEEYTYDEYDNVLTCRLLLDGAESTQAFAYTYTPEGRVETVEETVDGDFTSRQEYRYDDRGRIAEVLYYDGSGLLYSTLHTWEGNTETVTTLDADDQVTIVSIHTYDSDDGKGNLLRDETQQDGYVISCAEYTYEDIEISE